VPDPDAVQFTLDIGAPAAANVPAPLRQAQDRTGETAARSPEPDVPFTWTEAHRHACEVRHVQGLAADAREAYLQGIERKRGDVSARRLRQDALTT
jgi:hypothetical protein